MGHLKTLDFGFLTLLDSIKDLDYPTLWRELLLIFLRFAPIIALCPFFGAKIIPTSARVALALSLSILFLPTALFHTSSHTISDPFFAVLALKELFIGFILGLFSTVPFYIAQSSGIFIDYMRGSSMLMAQDPTLQIQSSSLGIMFNNYLLVLFWSLDGPLIFLNAVQTSFEIFPLDQFLNPLFFSPQNPLWKSSSEILNQVFTLSIELAAPALLAVLMAEVFLGIANRLAPQVQIAFLGMPLKSLLGLTLLWIGWYFFLKQMSNTSIHWVETINKFLLFKT